jgi:glycosyltransferase involved in cell wall biosynthesis
MIVRKICILGLEDYAMLIGDTRFGHVGGESVQHVLLARAWRDLGLDVSIIVLDHGQPRVTAIDGIRVIAAFSRDDGVRGLRFVHPRMTRVVRAMSEVGADVYYQSPAAHWAGVVAYYAKRHGKQSVLRIASDNDCMRGRMPLRYNNQRVRFKRDRVMYEFGVAHASVVAAQTSRQRELLLQNFGIHSEILNIAVEEPKTAADTNKDIDVLWVGNLREVKRPDIAIELARRLPQYRFVFVGGDVPGAEAYYQRIAAEARALPNVTFVGPVPYEAVGEWFDRSRLHLNTSDYEGFPNTYLQAWVRRLPVVSFFDPDGVIERRRLGCRARDIDAMSCSLAALLANPAECADMGARGYAYATSEFSVRKIAMRYLEVLQDKASMPARLRAG